MQINKENYEAYLLDLLEDSLDEQKKQELEEFLRLHPDCVPDLIPAEIWTLQAESVEYGLKERLKKSIPPRGTRIHPGNFDLMSIARMEGDLKPEQILEHDKALKSDEHKRDAWKQWQKMKLRPEKLVYPAKEGLRKKGSSPFRLIWITTLTAAASLALIWTLVKMNPFEAPEPERSAVLAEEPEVTSEQEAEAFPVTGTSEETGKAAVRAESAAAELPEPKAVIHLPREVQVSEDPTSKVQQDMRIEARPINRAIFEQGLAISLENARYDRIEALPYERVDVHLSSLSIGQLARLDLRDLMEIYTEEKNLSLLSLAYAGIDGINRLTGSDISLMASRDQSGELSGFSLRSRHFSWTRPLGREE